jgi:hypothetical protein
VALGDCFGARSSSFGKPDQRYYPGDLHWEFDGVDASDSARARCAAKSGRIASSAMTRLILI